MRISESQPHLKVATAGRAFGVYNSKDSTFQFKLPSGICTADVTFMGTSGLHEFHFTSDSAEASHVAWEHLDYEHTSDVFLLERAFSHHCKHPQVVELPLPRVSGFKDFYNPTRPSHLVGGALVRCHRSYSPTEIRSMRAMGLEQSPAYFSRRNPSISQPRSTISMKRSQKVPPRRRDSGSASQSGDRSRSPTPPTRRLPDPIGFIMIRR